MTSKTAKEDQLKASIVQPTQNDRITADFGTKQSNTDDWLRVSTKEKTGPMLLEDAFGREKVRFLLAEILESSEMGRRGLELAGMI